MGSSVEELESRISDLERDQSSRVKFFVQYLLSPLLVVIVGIIFNGQLEKGRKQVQQIQIAHSMLTTLFSDEESKVIATQRLMDELLESRALKDTLRVVVQQYLDNKFERAIEQQDTESAERIIDAARTLGGTVGDNIVKVAEAKTVHIIVASLKKEDAAITHAKNLKEKGFPSEVYLTPSGFYAVTIGKYPFNEATIVRTKAIQDGTTNEQSWLSQGKSWLNRVFPKEPQL